MRREAKRSFQVSSGRPLHEAGQFLLRKMKEKSPRVEKMLGVANRPTVGSVLVILVSCVLLTAQNVVLTGALSGRITDQSGAVVAGASVVVQNLGPA